MINVVYGWSCLLEISSDLRVKMGIVRHYITLALFTAGLLFGLQAPNFIDQYKNRIDVHLDEAKNMLAEYMQAADSIHTGNGNGVATQGMTNPGASTEIDYQGLRHTHGRLQRLEIERGALQSPLIGKIIHLLFYADDAVLEEMIQNYRPSISLTADAILSGLMSGFVLCCIFEVILSASLMILRRMREYRARQIEKKLTE